MAASGNEGRRPMIVFLALLFVSGAIQDPPIACNVNALTAAERQEHTACSQRLKSAVAKAEEVADGYRLYFDALFLPQDVLRSMDAGRWCCPFLDFERRLEREKG